ncbi:hypothetical protein G1J88_11695 [Tenacibaculum dicentrarchi]|nr:hypothetical protein [Tenacibaculum dicentrarchi]MCD8421189.1 hypothetical protein [Tenacibaculum dicentrarchi]MCD8438326.1 hypothetical protein [Tenacibaculum dicentrarchi]MCG8829043.1 hypothetical protein [Tenacibaculum dicentrarchi]
MKNTPILILFAFLLAGCVSTKITKEEKEIFEILNKITYQHNNITDEDIDYHTIAGFLNENEILKLKIWKSTEPTLKNFYNTECIGCSNNINKLTPIYRVEKGNFVHFGLKKSIGIENLVFNKKGNFITHFFTYQSYSQAQIEKELKKRGNDTYVISGIFPTIINTNEIHLKHLEYSNQTDNSEWYNTAFPMELEYYINVKEKQHVLRFKFNGGFYSYQKDDKNDDHRMIHFFEPEFVANTVDFNQLSSFSSKTKGYYGEATFFLIKIKKKMNLSVVINSKIVEKKFQFSILENNSFNTIEQYVNKHSELYTTYNKNLEKGEYLIRVINGKSTYWNMPLYDLNLKKIIL